MAGISLYGYQEKALKEMHNGCILNGGVGSGKSRTGIAYYFIRQGGTIDSEAYIELPKEPRDLYIITTARKRDTNEWNIELEPFMLELYENKVVVDSWNNIKKYINVQNAFFIFDEDRVTGNGVWVKTFLKITKSNDWILLSATPGDTWMDYVPVFIANGYYRNKTEFTQQHVIWNRYSKYPKVDRYLGQGRLLYLRSQVLVNMDFKRETVAHHENVWVEFNAFEYKFVGKNRWDPYKDEPIENASSLCYVWRKVVNSDPARQEKMIELFHEHPKMIVFYNFDYELEILKNLEYGEGVIVAEWNGHKHEDLPTGEKWVYLVNYSAGAEGWNCTTTDTIVFFSQNYSYKTTVQAAGRIDRLNTPYTDLYYFHLKSRSGIDLAISRALSQKKKFNESQYIKTTGW